MAAHEAEPAMVPVFSGPPTKHFTEDSFGGNGDQPPTRKEIDHSSKHPEDQGGEFGRDVEEPPTLKEINRTAEPEDDAGEFGSDQPPTQHDIDRSTVRADEKSAPPGTKPAGAPTPVAAAPTAVPPPTPLAAPAAQGTQEQNQLASRQAAAEGNANANDDSVEKHFTYVADPSIQKLGVSFLTFPPGDVLIKRAWKDTWAASLDIATGDILERINGQEVSAMKKADFQRMLYMRPLTLEITRPPQPSDSFVVRVARIFTDLTCCRGGDGSSSVKPQQSVFNA